MNKTKRASHRHLKFDVATKTEIGARFVAVRQALDYSQADLGERVGLTPARVMQIENGMVFGDQPTKPSVAALRLFEALERRTEGVSVDGEG